MFFILKPVFLSFAAWAGLLPLLSHILLFPPTLLAKEYHNEADGTPTITWKRPTSGATFQPGDTLAVEWISDTDIISPSIRLCKGSTARRRRSLREANKHHHRQIRRDSNCGESIWPEVQKTSNGSQRVDLDIPNVAEPRSYYLLMQDNFGSLTQSPSFSVSSGQDSNSDATSTNAANTITSASKPTPYTDELEPTNLPAAQAPLSRPSTGPVQGVLPSFNSTAKPSPGIPKGPIYVDSNNLLTHNHPAPVAAFAIPLVAAAAALLIAGGLAIRHCRARRKEREHDKLTIKILDKLRRSDTPNSSSLSTQSTASGNAPQIPPVQIQPIPLFMPMSMPISMEHGSSSVAQRTSSLNYPKTGDARQSTRQAYCYQSPLGPPASNRYSHSLSNDMSCDHLRRVSTQSSSGRSRRILPAMAPYTSSSQLSAPCLPSPSFARSMAKEELSISNSCTTSDILEDYCLPSPRLGSVYHDPLGRGTSLPLNSSPIKPPPLPPSLLSAPQRLHIRDEAPTGAPILPFAPHESEHEERVPSRMPTPARSLYREQRDAYAAIASLLGKS